MSRLSLIETLESRRLLSDSPVLFPNQFEGIGPSPSLRFEGYSAVVGDKLYVMGGFDSEFRTVPNIDVFDPADRSWTTIETRIPAAETHAGHAVDGSSIYFVGGNDGDLQPGRQQPTTRKGWRYDTATNTWDSIPPLPAPRGGGAMVRVDRTLHYFGGVLADRLTNSGAHWMLQLGKSSGGADDGTAWVRRPAMPAPRDHFSAVAARGRIWALGGEFGHDVRHEQSNLLHSFDPETGVWERHANMLTPKSHFESAAFVFGNKIIAAGGQVDDYRPTRDVQQYDMDTDEWVTVKSLPEARQGGVVLKMGNELIIGLGAVAANDPQDDVWIGKFRTMKR
jgi:N-acetylneuraminic acid mutarotase